MKIKEVAKLSSLDRLIYWINERDSIRRQRLLGIQPPWTDDTILQQFRFCNVRRMDDRVSMWLLDYWYKPNKNHPNGVVACALARLINLPKTLEEIGFPAKWDPEHIKSVCRGRKESGGKVYNAAYMIRGGGKPDKIEMIVDDYLQPLVNDPVEVDTNSMERTWRQLACRHGFGSFMAGQTVADLRHLWTGKWNDKCLWAPIGPGSKRGMNRLHDRPANAALGQEPFLDELLGLMEICHKRLPVDLMKRLEAIDIQNCLCESDKYARALFGEGRPKQNFNGAG